MTKIAFVGAGSTIFARNIVGDAMLHPALADATIALMDIDPARLSESAMVARKVVASAGAGARVETHSERRAALDGADFVIVAFQIGGYRPSTVVDFEIPKRHGLRQTIGDTLGVGGIMRGLRTVPHLWAVAEDMRAVCPDALMLQHANPMAINTWALTARYPDIRQAGLCHSIRMNVEEFARDLDLKSSELRYEVAGLNHMAFFLKLEARDGKGVWRDLYPRLRDGYARGDLPSATGANPRCHNRVRYEVMRQLGYFPTESSEHFAEYVPWFIKSGRDDLIERFGIPLDEYPARCEEQIADWAAQAEALKGAGTLEIAKSQEYAAEVMNAVATGEPAAIHANVANRGCLPQLPEGAAVEVPCLVDANGVQPVAVDGIPKQLVALMRTNLNVQELTVEALLTENPELVRHAAMMDPHTAAELDLGQIRALVDELVAAHGDWLPAWVAGAKAA